MNLQVAAQATGNGRAETTQDCKIDGVERACEGQETR